MMLQANHIQRRSMIGAGLVALACSAGAASAQLVYTSQVRSVSATTEGDGQSASLTAPDFAPFEQTVSLTTPVQGDAGPFNNTAVAGISCFLEPDGVRTRTRRSGGGGRVGGGGGIVVAGIAHTLIDVTFDNLTPNQFFLRAWAEDVGASAAANTVDIALTDTATQQPLFTFSGTAAYIPVNQPLDLPVGSYRLVLDSAIRVEGDAAQRTETIDFRLVVECDADMDDGTGTGTEDGAVTIDDLFYFLDAFAAGIRDADLDDGTFSGERDGAVTVDDLVYFLKKFDVGC